MKTFIDLFCGLGGFRIALESFGYKCIFSSDIDKYARKIYKHNFNDEPFGDIKTIPIKDIPDHTILVGGPPCQSFSVAGNRKGIEDDRGNLFLYTLNIIKHKQPKYFILENVKGLLSVQDGRVFSRIKKEINNIGYNFNIDVLNTRIHTNIPQNRERVFFVGTRCDIENKFSFPEPEEETMKIRDVLENEVDDKYFYKSKSKIFNNLMEAVNDSESVYQWRRKYVRENKSGVCPTITRNAGTGGHNVPIVLAPSVILTDVRAGNSSIHSWDIINTSEKEKKICIDILKNRRKKRYGGDKRKFLPIEKINEFSNATVEELDSLVDKKILIKKDNEYDLKNSRNQAGLDGVYRIHNKEETSFPTLTAHSTDDYIFQKEKRIRKLTPRECFRLQGYEDNYKFPKDMSDTNLYKLIGNSVTVPLIKKIIKNLL